VDNSRNHSLVIDLPVEQNGDNLGPAALELVVMGFAGCISSIYAMVAAKMRLAFSQLEITVDAEKPKEAVAVTSVSFDLRIKTDAPDNKIKKCRDNTLKTCPVEAIFLSYLRRLTLFQSFKNLSIPISVRGCFTIFSRTANGIVAISAPIIAASTT